MHGFHLGDQADSKKHKTQILSYLGISIPTPNFLTNIYRYLLPHEILTICQGPTMFALCSINMQILVKLLFFVFFFFCYLRLMICVVDEILVWVS